MVGGVFCFLTPFPSLFRHIRVKSFEISTDRSPGGFGSWTEKWTCLNQLKKKHFYLLHFVRLSTPFFSWMWSSIVFLLFGETPLNPLGSFALRSFVPSSAQTPRFWWSAADARRCRSRCTVKAPWETWRVWKREAPIPIGSMYGIYAMYGIWKCNGITHIWVYWW